MDDHRGGKIVVDVSYIYLVDPTVVLAFIGLVRLRVLGPVARTYVWPIIDSLTTQTHSRQKKINS